MTLLFLIGLAFVIFTAAILVSSFDHTYDSDGDYFLNDEEGEDQ